jgi:hypothetical protein
MKVIMVRDTPPYGHAPTYQISLTYLERQKSYGPDKLRWEEAEEKNQTTVGPLSPKATPLYQARLQMD